MNDGQHFVPQSIERLGYSVAEACKLIPCSRSHLHRAIKKGHFRVARDGTKVLISRQAIIDYLNVGDGMAQAEPEQ